MEAALLDLDFEAELRAFQARRSAGRSRGRHCSDLVHHVMAHLDKKRFGSRGEIDPVVFQAGYIWEDALSAAFGRQFGGRQIELEVDGGDGPPIFLTMDGFSAKQWRVREFKATRISAANPIRSSKFRHWHLQISAYCRAMGTQEAELVVLFINGSYEKAGGRFGDPFAKPFLLRFTERELEENWSLLLKANSEMS